LALESIHLDEKWRRQLSPGDLDTFMQIAGSMNAELGYE
jgi:hypothetical protein